MAAFMGVIEFAERHWLVPETRRPIVLRPWQKAALLAMFPADGSVPPYETFLISTVKKAGKTTLDAIATLYATLSFPAPEVAFCVANDEAQAQERVFEMIAFAVKRMGLVDKGEAVVSKSEIKFPRTGSRIVAISSDFAGAAGAIFGISSWTELWAFRYEGHVRLWEELTPIPNRRSLRIVDSYAGFTGDSPILEPMWARALAGTRLDDDLPIYANGKLWAYIDQGVEAQERAWRGQPGDVASYYEEQAATLRPGTYARLHLNLWQSGEEAFITSEDWDACVDGNMTPLLPIRGVPLSVGVDAATKGDCAAVVAVTKENGRIRVCGHKVWTPRKGAPLDLEETVERHLLHLHEHFDVRSVHYDPYQMARSAVTLQRAGLPMVEFPQTSGNLTAAGQNLFELIRGRNLTVYPDTELRQHALNAVAVETGRGWRIAKEKSSRKIDALAALSFAAYDAISRHASGAEVVGTHVWNPMADAASLGRELAAQRDPRYA